MSIAKKINGVEIPQGAVDVSGTPSDGQVAIWTTATDIEGSAFAGGYTIMVAANNALASEKVAALASGGAVCDNTADEVEIEAAIAVLAAGNGGILQLSSGTFTLATNAEIDVDDDSIWIRGMGFATKLVQGDTTESYGIFEITADNIVLSDLFVQGFQATGANPGTKSKDSIEFIGAQDCILHNIWGRFGRNVVNVGAGSANINITNLIGYDVEHVLQFYGANHCNATNIQAYNRDTTDYWLQRGITIHNDNEHINVSNVYVDSPDETGIYLGNTGASTKDTKHININNVHVWHNDSVANGDPTMGIQIESSDDTYGIYHLNISNVTIDDMDFPIRVTSVTAGFVDHVILSNINCNGTVGETIDVADVGGDFIIRDCDGYTTGNYNCLHVEDCKVQVYGGHFEANNSTKAGVALVNADDTVLDGVRMGGQSGTYQDLSASSCSGIRVIGGELEFGKISGDLNQFELIRNVKGYMASGDVKAIHKVIDHASLVDGSDATAYMDFDEAIPAGSIIKSVKCDFTEAFNSDDTTTLTMMIGEQADLDDYNTTADPGENAFNHTTDVFWGESDCQDHIVTSATTPRVTFTEDDDGTDIINSANAQGKVTITITYMKA